MSDKSAIYASVNYADACHINGEHTARVENEHSSRDLFDLVAIIELTVQLIDLVVAAACVPCWLHLLLECNQYRY